MNERENFINNLERAINLAYGEGREFVKLTIGDVKRILQLIKEQEAVAPIYEEGEDFLNYFMKHTMGRCGHCKAPLPALEGMRSKFCWMCGKQVKWE